MSNTTTISAPVSTLAQACVFKGERIATMAKMSAEDAIRLGVYKINAGDTERAQGVFVIASKAKEITDATEAKAFMASLKAEFVNGSVQRATDALPATVSKVTKDGILAVATAEGTARFNNLGQAIRAARFILDNPGKVADSVSVFTVTQANAFVALEAPKADADAKTKAEYDQKAKIANVVLPMLKKGASQAAVKKAIADTKAEIVKAKEASAPKDTRSDEEKAKSALDARERGLVSKAVGMLCYWDELLKEGCKPEELRRMPVMRNPDGTPDKAQGTLQSKVRELAILAGLEVK